MSGTSADGVDIALTAVSGRGWETQARLLLHHQVAFSPDLKRRIISLRESGVSSLETLGDIGLELSHTYAIAVNDALARAGLNRSQLTAVAAHGQTLYHHPPATIQWLDPAMVAAHVGAPVVSDFRRADCAAGGQGAPLVPFADYLLFRHPVSTRAMVNLGGIANVTLLKAGCAAAEVLAFDTGPGNCISDYLCRKYQPGTEFDAGGKMALYGLPLVDLATQVLGDPFFHKTPPKSTDVPQMIALWDKAYVMIDPRPLPDLLATACYITATAILDAVYRALGRLPDEFIVSGGGCRNASILGFLKATHGVVIRHSDDYGLPSAAKEAVSFALLAAATLDGVPSNLPSVTGARREVILGSITPAP